MTLSNRQPMLDKLNEQLRELGRESVKSTLAKPQMALAVIRAARAALINQDDAKSVYAEYMDQSLRGCQSLVLITRGLGLC